MRGEGSLGRIGRLAAVVGHKGRGFWLPPHPWNGRRRAPIVAVATGVRPTRSPPWSRSLCSSTRSSAASGRSANSSGRSAATGSATRRCRAAGTTSSGGRRLGVWGMATVEHHFHSEGYEVGPNPGDLDAYWAAITENVRVGQLGYIMSAQNPIRVAEETAILEPPLPRPDVRRLPARLPVSVDERPRPAPRRRARPSPPRARPRRRPGRDRRRRQHRRRGQGVNRDVFEEQVDLVLESWDNDSIESKRPLADPVPLRRRHRLDDDRDAASIGADGEMDDRTSPPGQRRARARSRASTRRSSSPATPAARRSSTAGARVRPDVLLGIERAAEYGQAYVEPPGRRAASTRSGQNQALVRWGNIAPTMAEARSNVEA